MDSADFLTFESSVNSVILLLLDLRNCAKRTARTSLKRAVRHYSLIYTKRQETRSARSRLIYKDIHNVR